MKIKFYILILAVILTANTNLNAQARIDTLATVAIENAYLNNKYEVEFDLLLFRNDNRWLYWANGTFMFKFSVPTETINEQNFTITLLPGTSDLNIFVPTGGGILPKDEYLVTPRIINGRFSVTVAGPETFQYCMTVDSIKPLKIGRFRIENLTKHTPPTTFEFLKPYDYYQACAYKLDRDSIFIPNLMKYNINDNVEIGDTKNTYLAFRERPVYPSMFIKNFRADYMGSLKVRLTWETESEAYNEGFVVKRSTSDPGGDLYAGPNWNYVVGSYQGYKQNDALLGMGTANPGRKYEIWDSLPSRGFEYCYQLSYKQKIADTLATYDSIRCVQPPNSVLTDASAYPNPFWSSSEIYIWFEDDVIINASVYDIKGRLVEDLIKGEEFKYYGSKRYTSDDKSVESIARLNKPYIIIKWTPDLLAQQGLYEIIVRGTPVKDPTVEKSVAVVKLQYVR